MVFKGGRAGRIKSFRIFRYVFRGVLVAVVVRAP